MSGSPSQQAIREHLSTTRWAILKGWQRLTGCSEQEVQFALDALGADHVMGILYVVQYPRCGHAADVLKEPIIRQVGQCSLCEAECERA